MLTTNIKEIKPYILCDNYIDTWSQKLENNHLLEAGVVPSNAKENLLLHTAAHIRTIMESVPNSYRVNDELLNLINSLLELMYDKCDAELPQEFPEELETKYKEQPWIVDGKQFYVLDFLVDDLDRILDCKDFAFTQKEKLQIETLRTYLMEKGWNIAMKPIQSELWGVIRNDSEGD